MKTVILTILVCVLGASAGFGQRNVRSYGLDMGVLPTGPENAITDVGGVLVGHRTVIAGDSVRTGVTAVRPHGGNLFREKVPAAVYVENGFGKLTGTTQIRELGTLETPIVLTNTLSVPTAAEAVLDYVLGRAGNEEVRSVNPVVGETNDGYLNDIRGRHLGRSDVRKAIRNAASGPVAQGNVGAGTGTRAFGFKGGIGTSSRRLPESAGGFTVGVLVQTNFGGVLRVDGVPVGEELGRHYLQEELDRSSEGSCMMVVATDAPLGARNLERLAKRAVLGMARTGGFASNGSGDYVIAFSTAESVRVPHESEEQTRSAEVLRNAATSPLFLAAVEATEEAIVNSLFHAETMEGRDGHRVEALPVPEVLEILRKYGREVGR